MARKKKSRWLGVLFGPALVFFALTALWKNETRFDFHRAATATEAVAASNEASSGQLISLTGPMDRQLTLPGDYVESFTGYLMVKRHAEIHAWDRSEDSDDNVTWKLRWMNSLESNSRNRGIRQVLSSKRIVPSEYEVGGLSIDSDRIEFVDALQKLYQAETPILKAELVAEGDYLYLRANHPRGLGDERVSYKAIPVPETATWFGKFDSKRGVADTSHQRDGFVNQMIKDTGILHHLVAGDRTVALGTMKSYLNQLKWIVRAAGAAGVVTGLFALFATFTGLLFHVPVIGRLAEWGTFLMALTVGLPLALLTIVASYLIAHPVIPVLIIAGIAAIFFMIHRGGKASQQSLRSDLEKQYGHALTTEKVKELEFLELAQLSMSNKDAGGPEQKVLKKWAGKQRWKDSKFEELMSKAQSGQRDVGGIHSTDVHLSNLVRLALADGTVTHYEIKTIRKTARSLGYDDAAVRELITRVRQSTNRNA